MIASRPLDLRALALVVGLITVAVREPAQPRESIEATTAAVEAALRALAVASGVGDRAVKRMAN